MKSPHCPSCGKSHWSTQRCGALQPKGGSPIEGGTDRKSPDDIGLVSEEKACETATLTNAQRQKQYRDKKGDSYREANKLRMRKVRDV